MTRTAGDLWTLRSVPDDLAQRYVAEGWWNDESLGATVANGLATLGGCAFNVHSAARPWRGTFGEIDRAARSLAASLRERGVGPGDVVVFQLPNWVEAGITFWAAAYLGAVVVPIVHFYGPKEVGYILRTVSPAAVVTPDRFGQSEYLSTYETLLAGSDLPASPLWLVVRGSSDQPLPAAATPFESMLTADSIDAPAEVDPDAPASWPSRRGRRATPRA
jgi:non-ribosomal peptide synthetase component E (peptide arylation enzyme)